MIKVNLLAAAAAALLLGGTALAKDEKPAGAPKEKKICKGETSSTSRIAKTRICRTKAEWDELASQQSESTEAKLRGANRNY